MIGKQPIYVNNVSMLTFILLLNEFFWANFGNGQITLLLSVALTLATATTFAYLRVGILFNGGFVVFVLYSFVI